MDGLRARGWHDTALEYLDSISTNPLVPAEFKAVIPYEKALTLIAASRNQRDLEARFSDLDRAESLLRQFIQSQASHPRAYAARSQLGNLIVERARIKVEQSKLGAANASSDRESLLREARRLYDQAFEQFQLLEQAVTKELEAIPKVLDTRDRKQAALIERRKQLRADNLQTELMAAATREEGADTLPEGSKEQLAYLTEAASLYDAIYKKYRSRLAGLYARLYQGRCNARLGKTKDALGYYGELLDQPDQPDEMRQLKTKTLRLALESWLAPNEKKYMEAIKQAAAWLLVVPRSEQRSPDMLAIRYRLALAYKMQADDLASRPGANRSEIAVSLANAKKHAEYVASEPGELQEEAQQLVVKLGGRLRTNPDEPPTSFAQAQEAAKKALDQVNSAAQAVAAIQQQQHSVPAAERERSQQQLAAAQADLSAKTNAALQAYRLAMQLADASTPPSELNLARYFVCYLYYLDQRYYEAAVAGDFVSKRFPQSPGAFQCAKISLASYIQILMQSDPVSGNGTPDTDDQSRESLATDRKFEIAKVASAALYIADRWPGNQESIESLAAAVPQLVNAGGIDAAAEITQRIPEDHPSRWQCELMTGQGMWGMHIQSLGENDSSRWAASALKFLESGYQHLPESPPVTQYYATAILSLAQAQVEAGRFGDAIDVLEHETIGPMTLVTKGHDAAKNPLFAEQTYRTALQAYVGALSDDPSTMSSKAQSAMTALQQITGNSPEGRKRMLATYVQLAQSVESQLASASPDKRQELSKVFEAFLQQLSSGATDPGVLNWVGETFASLGNGLNRGNDQIDPNASRYYDMAIATFNNLIAQTTDPALLTQFTARLAEVKASKGDFAGALDDFIRVLTQNPRAMNLQVAAAELLQRWGAQDVSRLRQAIAGLTSAEANRSPSLTAQPTQPDDKVIWGWGKIASAALPHHAFRETFFRARYEMARCEFDLARQSQSKERNQHINNAKRILMQTKQLYPGLGGESWQQRYDQLLQQIESF